MLPEKDYKLMRNFLIYILFLIPVLNFAQNNCTVKNQTFNVGEQLDYKILYNWGIIWLSAGEASSNIFLDTINGKSLYRFLGVGVTYPQYDWVFKVRDRYESYADTISLKPHRFIREVYEGNYYAYDNYIFNHHTNLVYTTEKRKKKDDHHDSIVFNACYKDVVTAVFYVRCIDFSKYKSNDTIPLTFVLDGEIYPSYLRYLGKEIITSELLGDVRCIKFKPNLIEGTIFKKGEGMTVWVTDDKNKIPVYVETPIIVGKIKVELVKYTGLRNKIDCVIQK